MSEVAPAKLPVYVCDCGVSSPATAFCGVCRTKPLPVEVVPLSRVCDEGAIRALARAWFGHEGLEDWQLQMASSALAALRVHLSGGGSA